MGLLLRSGVGPGRSVGTEGSECRRDHSSAAWKPQVSQDLHIGMLEILRRPCHSGLPPPPLPPTYRSLKHAPLRVYGEHGTNQYTTMDHIHSSFNLYSTSSVDQDPDLYQNSPPPQEHSPHFASPDSFSTPTSHLQSDSFLDRQQLLAPVFYDPPLDIPPLDIPPATISPMNRYRLPSLQNSYEQATPFGFPSAFPHVSTNAVDTWMNDGSSNEPFPIHRSPVLGSGNDSDSPGVLGHAIGGPISSNSPLDSELIGLFGLSDIFSPFNVPLSFDFDARATPEALLPSSLEHSGGAVLPFAIRPPSIPIIDLPSSSEPHSRNTQAHYSRQSRYLRQRRGPVEDNRNDDGPGPSTSASPEGPARQSADHPPISGYSVMELEHTGSQPPATDLEGTSMMGRVSLPPVDESTTYCLHDNRTKKQPRHWQYNCKYNPNRQRIPCIDPKCTEEFSSKSNMKRHWDKRHGPGAGDGSG